MRGGRRLGVTEEVVDERQKGANAIHGSLEHMFVRVERVTDGLQGLLQTAHGAGDGAPARLRAGAV
jgi:hypothetical protein